MNHTQIDQLMQLPLPTSRDVGGGPNRVRGEGVTFDRHFQSVRNSSTAASPPAPPRKSSEREESKTPPSTPAEPPAAKAKPPQAEATAAAPAAQEPAASPAKPAAENAVEPEDTSVDAADVSEAVDVVAAVVTIQAQQPSIDPATEEPIANLVPPTEAAETPEAPPRESNVRPAADMPQPAAARRQAKRVAPSAGPAVEATRAAADDELTAELDVPAETSREPRDARRTDAKPGDKPGAAVTVDGADDPIETATVATDAEPAAEPHASRPVAHDAGAVAAAPRERRRAKDSAVVEPVEPRGRRSNKPAAARTAEESTERKAEVVERPLSNQANDAAAPATTEGPAAPVERATESQPADSRQRPAVVGRAVPVQSAPATSAPPPPTIIEAAPEDRADGAARTNPTASEAKPSVLTALARFERNGALGARAAHGGDSKQLPHVDPARFVGRVARAIHMAQDRGGPLLLRLSPPELGSLRLELSLQQGVLSATIEADNTHARQMLLDNLPALRDRLAEQNVRIERFDVDVRRDGDGREPSNFNPQHHKQQHQHAPQHRGAAGREAAAAEPTTTTPTPSRAITDTSINIIA